MSVATPISKVLIREVARDAVWPARISARGRRALGLRLPHLLRKIGAGRRDKLRIGPLEGRVCVVTGGPGSLGFASARLFLREGAKVMPVDRRADDLARALAGLNDPDAGSAAAHVSRSHQLKSYIETTVGKWGKIDVLFSDVGNAGSVAPVQDYPEDVSDPVIAVHVRGAFRPCRYGLPNMKDGGSIIIAQVGLMRSVAKAAAPRGIRVYTLHPGPIDNAFQLDIEKDIGAMTGRDATRALDEATPLHRHASPDEIARSALDLASDLSSFTTGSTLMVEGGMSA